MNKRGPKPKGKVKIRWSSDFAYAIGLIVTDGNLSPNGRHINFTTKDYEQSLNFMKALNITVSVGKKSNGAGGEKKYFFIQFSDVIFYNFLIFIGITPNKSKKLGQIILPNKYFFHFLRGVFDGDGYVHSYFDPRWKSSFLWYLGFCSASPDFLNWIRNELNVHLGIKGHITQNNKQSCKQLKYAKSEAKLIVKKIYSNSKSLSLTRKRLKIKRILAIVGKLSSKK